VVIMIQANVLNINQRMLKTNIFEDLCYSNFSNNI